MAKKKEKVQIVNHIQDLNLEIDYDKLAEAIITAQENTNKKKKRTSRFRGSFMGGINGALYFSIALFAIAAIIGMWIQYVQKAEYPLITYIVCTVLFSIVSLYAFFCQKESLDDTDEAAQQHFNTNVTLIALIIAIVALVKG